MAPDLASFPPRLQAVSNRIACCLGAALRKPAGVMIWLAILVFAGNSAAQDLHPPRLPQTPYDYSAEPSDAGLARLRDPSAPPLDNRQAALGRVLFYDRQLSANGLVSCATCHTQSTGFDDRTRFSIGFAGIITNRAAMPLANALYNPGGRYFWDARASSLEIQVLIPFTDTVEMGLGSGELVGRIRSRDWYGPLFADAFGDAEITEPRIAKALAQFVRAITAFNTPYDLARGQQGDRLAPFPLFSEIENRGKFLFFAEPAMGGAGCAQCHVSDAFIMTSPANNGLDRSAQADPGVGGITGNGAELGLFRAASLKNIARTAPYMHDGRFGDLQQVVRHYAQGIEPHPNLSPLLRAGDGTPLRLRLSSTDIDALVAFLETLTDEAMLVDPRFSDPFSRR